MLSKWITRVAFVVLGATVAMGQIKPPVQPVTAGAEANRVELGGTWGFRLDRKDEGEEKRWFEAELPERATLPGDLSAQGIGDPVTVNTKWIGDIADKSWFTHPRYEKYGMPGNVKMPFWLQPETYYAGASWFSREVVVPIRWSGRRVVLTLERPHWQTRVWVDGKEVGTQDSLSTPHVYELPNGLGPGKHRVTIRVDNRLIVDVGVNSHSISDHTQGDWNGIVGKVTLESTATTWIDALKTYPDEVKGEVKVTGQVKSLAKEGAGTLPPKRSIILRAALMNDEHAPGIPEVKAEVKEDGTFEAAVPLGEKPERWDEFHPSLYELTASLPNGEMRRTTFGLRRLGVSGTQFTINGRPLFVRGTLECAVFPKTGHPPTEVAEWKRILQIARAHGLNVLRFHSWCPPEAAFVAGDELGFYFQVEAGSWANQSTTIGDGKPVDAWVEAESKRILDAYGNHPSFTFMLYGNEPGGSKQKEWLSGWVERRKAEDGRRLYSGASGWPEMAANQFAVLPGPRIQQWGEGLKSRINALPPETVTDYRKFIAARSVPVVCHEMGQWCVYPNFDEMKKYTGYLKPRNFEIFKESLEANHMGEQAHDFLIASGKLQALCYKEEIEAALRTRGMAGFELLDLHDFPGQGTALVGVLDPFWESKGYITAEEFRRFCGPTVPLARLPKRVYTTTEALSAEVEVAHFGTAPLEGAETRWKLMKESGEVVVSGVLPTMTIPLGNGTKLGAVKVPMAFEAPAKYKLVVAIVPKGAAPIENDWDLWLYPARVEPRPAGVAIASDWTPEVEKAANEGGKVLLRIPAARVPGNAQLGFSPIFWNTAWTKGQPPHTLGILCDPKHPALAAFPTEGHTNWQWWYLVKRSEAMVLDGLPVELKPTVQVVDDWVTNRRLGLMMEAQVGKARMVVTSMPLDDQDPVNRQMRTSVLTYMASDAFVPKVTLTKEQVQGLIGPPPGRGRVGR